MRPCLECRKPFDVMGALCLDCRRPSARTRVPRQAPAPSAKPAAKRPQEGHSERVRDRRPELELNAHIEVLGWRLRLLPLLGIPASLALSSVGLSNAASVVLLGSLILGLLGKWSVEAAYVREWDQRRAHLRETQQLLDDRRRARGEPPRSATSGAAARQQRRWAR